MLIIIGGGIAGLSLGWQLIQRSAPVTIIEKNTIGSGASWAASAYLEPRPGRSALRRLEHASLAQWPDFARAVEDSSGCDIDFRSDGQLRIIYGPEEPHQEAYQKLINDIDTRRGDGWQASLLQGQELYDFEPALSKQVSAAAYLPQISWLDGRKLCTALAAAIRRKGGEIIEHCAVQDLACAAHTATGVVTERGELLGEKVILCSGLGHNDFAHLPADILPARPVKGVTITLDETSISPAPHFRAAPLLTRMIKYGDYVLCPRQGGRILIGSTHEDGASSLDIDDATIQKLRRQAMRAVPILENAKLSQTACGIRSLIGDGLLRLGQSKELKGLYYSLSHAGAGFIRAPLIAEQFADYILTDKEQDNHISPFLARR